MMEKEEYFYKKKRPPEIVEHFPKETMEAFRAFDQLALREGALPSKTKELIAVACAHITRCPYCISGHARRALKLGATKEEIAEAILVAAALGAGASLAHSHFALGERVEP